ncbi:MAG TPA: class I SAM-dependent methyltransferase [Beijerinckiaceae bacterium]
MSGFSADWLALREPADHRARSPRLLARLKASFPGPDEVRVIDLGCGTGSNLRACAPHLPERQAWTLVDHDPALLAAARGRLAGWGDGAEAGPEGLRIRKGGADIAVRFVEADLAGGADTLLAGDPGLVTAAALFDLVSDAWIEAFARRVADAGAVFYTALTYDGAETWTPPHPADRDMLAAFLAHQRRDKGLGPAAGPAATEILARAFRARGYTVQTAASPWRLGPEDAALVRALAQGTADAVRETGEVPEGIVRDWLEARLSAAAACAIGHADLLAVPPRRRDAGAAPR